MFDTQLSKEFPVGNSSVTDSDYIAQYATLCGTAAKNEEIFKKFRSAQVMVEALDHVSIEQGNAYISQILKYGTWSSQYTKVIQKIDLLGKPRKFKFRHYGTFSPTLLRYLKVYLDLKNNFGEVKNLNVAEIGIGFGGQSSLICLLDNPASYTFYDIPPVIELAKRFISELSLQGEFKFFDGRNPVQSMPDLVVSNYAFSELSRSVQDIYLKNVILHSQRGYITWNSSSIYNSDAYSLADLVRLIPNSHIIPEQPNTAVENAIIIWGNKNK
jgi:hypothetical protein